MKKQLLMLLSGVAMGLTSFSVAYAAVPSGMRVTDDTAIYQNLSEIRVPRAARPNFDGDIARLAGQESRYRERLPSLNERSRVALNGPMKRVSAQKYQYSGASKRSARH